MDEERIAELRPEIAIYKENSLHDDRYSEFTSVEMEAWVRDAVDRHGDDGDRFALSGILEDRDRLRSQLASFIDLIQKRYPRLLERGNPLYDGVLARAVDAQAAAQAVVAPEKKEKDCGDCKRISICNGALACLCGSDGKLFDRDQPQQSEPRPRGGDFYKSMVTIPLDLLVEIRRMYGIFAKTHLGLSGDIARMDDAIRATKGGAT